MRRYMKYKLLAFVMSLMMMVSMLPTTIFAENLIPLEGKLKIKGESVVGTELQINYEEVLTSGFTNDQVKFSWMRTTLEAEEEAELNQTENTTREEIGKEPTYILTAEDVGYIVILRITGLEEYGYTGFLEAKTDVICDIEEEIVDEVLLEEPIEESIEESIEEDMVPEPVVEEVVDELTVDEEITFDAEETIVEEFVNEEMLTEEQTFDADNTVPEENVSEVTVEEESVSEETITENPSEEVYIEEIIVEEMTFDADGAVVEEPVYSLTTNLETNVIDFGKFIIGEELGEAVLSFTLINNGTGDITITIPVLNNFVIEKVNPESPDVITPGNQIEYSVNTILTPELTAGLYIEGIVLGEEGKATVGIDAMFELIEAEPTETPAEPAPDPTETPEEPTPEPTETPEESTPEPTETPEEPTPEPTETPEEPEIITSISVQPSSHNFGVREEGYGSAPDAQYITVINTGNTELTLIQPVSEYYEISALETVVLEPDGSISFTVKPREGLGKGDYSEIVYIETVEGVGEFVELSFVVASKTVKLQGIARPADITGLKNGVKKTEKGLQLPSTVTISTTNGEMKANVTWDLETCEYNRKSVKPQNFTVKGKVTLPEGIKNPDEISLSVSVNVSVNGYTPKIADAAQNSISGISSDNYTTQSKITFTAIGAGMDNENPRKGDVRYCPASWGVFNNNTWKGAPYSAAFGMGQAGSYNLSVIFNRQQYDGESWVNTGEQDKKTVTFTVVQSEDGVNLTPVPEKHDSNQKEAVATGDTTVILPLIVALAVALICIIAVLIYRKKR